MCSSTARQPEETVKQVISLILVKAPAAFLIKGKDCTKEDDGFKNSSLK